MIWGTPEERGIERKCIVLITNWYLPNENHPWALNDVAVTQNASGPVPTVVLKPTDGSATVFPMSDIHIGANAFHRELFEAFLAEVIERDAYVVLLGDIFEMALPSHIEHSVWEQDLDPDQQLELALEFFMPIRDRIIISTGGNHDARVWKKTGVDLARILARELGCYYVRNGGYFKTQVGDQSYTWAIFHGAQASINPFTELEKRLSVYDESDILAMGHNHQLCYKTVVKKRIKDGAEERHLVYLLRTGSFISEPEYSRSALYSPTLEGCPIVELGAKERSVYIDVHGEALWN